MPQGETCFPIKSLDEQIIRDIRNMAQTRVIHYQKDGIL